MTASELADLREEVRGALAHAGRGVMHSFSPEVLAEARPGHVVPPFAIICSRTMDHSVGRWGHMHLWLDCANFRGIPDVFKLLGFI